MSYRNDVDALAARRDALADDVARSQKELDDAERQLAEATRRARLPVLDNIRIASPCTFGWANMTGDDRVRHCGQCKKDVFNLTSMTRAEVEALIVAKNGDLCARYFQRHDGTIMLADCDIGAKRRRRLKLVAAGAAALLAGGAVVGAMLVRGGDAKTQRPHSELGENIDGGLGRHVERYPQSRLGDDIDGGLSAEPEDRTLGARPIRAATERR